MNDKQIKKLLASPARKAFNFGIIQSGNVDLMIYGGIGFELDVDELVSELKGTDATQITVYINSVGGYAYDGIAIYNALRNHPANIITCVEGLAASAASVIAMAGDEVQIGKTAFLMIHNPMSIVMGESKDMRQEADSLDKLQAGLAQAYAKKSGRPPADFLPLMDAETWFSADEAKAAGLVDVITDDDTEPAVSEDALNVYNHVPGRLRAVARARKNNQKGTNMNNKQNSSNNGVKQWNQLTEDEQSIWLDQKTYERAMAMEAADRAKLQDIEPTDVESTAKSEWKSMTPDARGAWVDEANYVKFRKIEANGQLAGTR